MTQQGFFVAEDHVHTAVRDFDGAGHTGFISSCGWQFHEDEVLWTGDHEPLIWRACPDCAGAFPEDFGTGSGVVTVLGVYALGDEAHLFIERTASARRSVCGREDAELEISWAGEEWPAAYTECAGCIRVCDPQHFRDDSDAVDRAAVSPGAGMTVDERVATLRMWAVTPQEFEHRPRDTVANLALCGAELPLGTKLFPHSDASLENCRECEREAGRIRNARAAARLATDERVGGTDTSTGNTSQNIGTHTRNHSGSPGKSRRAKPSSQLQRRGSSQEDSQRGPATQGSAATEMELYGRRMVVPFRLVRGGAPGLGRRR